MAQTSNKKLHKNGNAQFDMAAPASAGTYYSGDMVAKFSDDTNVKILSASAVAGGNGVGMVAEYQVIATSGDTLKFQNGQFILSASGFTAADTNNLAWCGDAAGAVYDAQGTNRLVIGRYLGPSQGAAGFGIFNIGTTPSGSAV